MMDDQVGSRTIRVFISSTFHDMQTDREHLVKFIFPQLRKLCQSRQVVWSEVDLRWGITEEANQEQMLSTCLAEIDRCLPFFIGILGERYGSVLESFPPDLIDKEPWLAEHSGCSVTELEILHAVLNNPQKAQHSLFYFRDPKYIKSLTESEQQLFLEIPSQDDIDRFGLAEATLRADQRKARLADLKQRIRRGSLHLRENYGDPDQLGEWLLEDMTALIDHLYPEGSLPDPLLQESLEHEAFAASRSRIYIGGDKYFAQLDNQINGSNLPLAVLGESGSGKSTLLANWALKYRKEHPDELVLMHFIGASAGSSDWAAMLRRLMAELKAHFNIQQEIPADPDQLRTAFPNWLFMASAKGKVVLILDALNQLEDRQGAQELSWLPLELPENVKIILSTLPCRALQVIQERKWPTLTVEPLSFDERKRLIIEFLAQYGKELSHRQVETIIHDPQSNNPLALTILLDELRQFGQYERLDEIISHYLKADSIPEMFELVLQRCEEDYERQHPGLVRDVMRCTWASRRGLSESELLDLLGQDGQPLPHRLWSPLYLALEHSLFTRSGLLYFFHDFIREGVEMRYVYSDELKEEAHIRLADYFERIEGNPIRKVDELPWQLAQANTWHSLYDLLGDVEFFEQLWTHNYYDLLGYWAEIESHTELTRVDAYHKVSKYPEVYKVHVLNWLAMMYSYAGRFDEAMALHKVEERIYHQLGNLDSLSRSLGNQALILKAWGKLDEAMTLHKEREHICRQLGNLDGLQASLGNQALILKTWGKLDEVMVLLKEQERICRLLGKLGGLQNTLGNQANIFFTWGKLDEAMALHKEEERICRQLGNLDGLQVSQGNQALILQVWGKLDEAMELLKEQERICHQLGNLNSQQRSLGNQAVILQVWGRLDESMALLKEQECICRQLGELEGLQVCLGNQALILKDWGKLDEAMALHMEEERICRQIGILEGLEASLGNQALILKDWDRLDEAMALHKEQECICRQLGKLDSLGISLANQANILKSWGRLDEAMELYKEGEYIFRQVGNQNCLQIYLGNQASIMKGWDKLDEAMALYKEQECICRQLGNLDYLVASLGNQALILKDWGRLDEAIALHKEEERICRQLGYVSDICISLVNQGAVHKKLGDRAKHIELVEEALALAQENGLTALADKIEGIFNSIKMS